MPKLNDSIEIGGNCIRFANNVLKISNISRTWVFQFLNRDKIAHEKEKLAYENARTNYVAHETYKKNTKRNNFIAAAFIFFIISSACFLIAKTMKVMPPVPIGIVFLILALILGYSAYKTGKKPIIYDVPPPSDKPLPEKYGLGIQMNSAHCTYFTAIGLQGLQELRKLQEDINNEELQREGITINLTENNIKIEDNQGIISTGDNANNHIEQKELTEA